MLLSPGVLALLLCSALVAVATTTAAAVSLSIVAGWDPDDPGPRQLARERRSFLVETTVAVVLGCQLLSVFLFVATAERLHPLLPGAMCAVGTLNASRFGYPLLTVKVGVFLLSGLWLAVHRAASDAASTALVRVKHLSLVAIAAVLVAENVVQVRYFADLDPQVLTSCCATVFGEQASGLGSELASLPPPASRAVFFAALAATLGAGWLALRRRRPPRLYALLSLLLGGAALAAVISWVAPGFYELPTHHCPFCLLSAEYAFVGYPLYLSLAVAVVAGLGSGAVHGLRAIDPFHSIVPMAEHRLCALSMTGFGLFSLITLWPAAAMGLRMLHPGGA